MKERRSWSRGEELIKEVIALFSGVINENNATLVWNQLPIITDPSMAIRLIFQNLIGNALKYQAKGTQPKISITGLESETHWHFEVKDNGIGIEEAKREQIFELFKRLHSKEQYPGTGLGLAICKKIIESLGGSIWVTSAPKGRSIFTFTVKKLSTLSF